MVSVDIPEIFKQLAFARYGLTPFTEFGDWNDENLWVKLLQVLNERRCFEYDMDSLISLIVKYAKKYEVDPDVNWIKDDSLKNNICLVFSSEPLKDRKGHLSIAKLEVIQGRNRTDIHTTEHIGENSCSPGGRSFVKRFRGAGSSSDEEEELSRQISYHCDNDHLSAERVTDVLNHFYKGSEKKIRAKILTWLKLTDANQVKYIKGLPPSNEYDAAGV
ncbi:hypothetical protein TSUD_142680 [Trifolium subterraneum]|uniref:Uncharacterized protein n=1 Tax=Trifolium subterraneum TaxID=3900 RepID=A0A2Z6LXC7_TRISU|nr:hypothetical protein TSUD_142680 [Trifolium subterraneum]